MTSSETIAEILSVYKKHGWKLHRVLLTDQLKENLSDSMDSLCGKAELVSSEIDAAWFYRASGKDRTAWELRHLSEVPFALFEVFDKDLPADTLNEGLLEMESRLKSRLINPK